MFRTRSIINHTLLHQVSTSLWLTAHKAQNTLFFWGRNFSPISSLLFRVSITFGCLAGVLIPNFSALKQFLNRTRLQQLIGREKSQFYWHIYHVAARKVLEFVSDFSLCLLEFCFPLGEAVRSEKPNVWMQTKREKIEIFIEKVTEWVEHTKKNILRRWWWRRRRRKVLIDKESSWREERSLSKQAKQTLPAFGSWLCLLEQWPPVDRGFASQQ